LLLRCQRALLGQLLRQAAQDHRLAVRVSSAALQQLQPHIRLGADLQYTYIHRAGRKDVSILRFVLDTGFTVVIARPLSPGQLLASGIVNSAVTKASPSQVSVRYKETLRGPANPMRPRAASLSPLTRKNG
jgi:hypothetical protein